MIKLERIKQRDPDTPSGIHRKSSKAVIITMFKSLTPTKSKFPGQCFHNSYSNHQLIIIIINIVIVIIIIIIIKSLPPSPRPH